MNRSRKIEMGLTVAALVGALLTAAASRGPGLRGPGLREIEAGAGLAQLRARHGQAGAAVEICEDLLAETSHPFVRLRAAEAYYRAGDPGRAEAMYRRLAEASPPSPLALFNLATVLRRQGREAESDACLARFREQYGAWFPALAGEPPSGDLPVSDAPAEKKPVDTEGNSR